MDKYINLMSTKEICAAEKSVASMCNNSCVSISITSLCSALEAHYCHKESLSKSVDKLDKSS